MRQYNSSQYQTNYLARECCYDTSYEARPIDYHWFSQ
nr:MAG TPA: hypothetical protein [Caudoviricetes sp.]